MSKRHAIYFAPPPGSPLHDLGSQWLGRDAFTGEVRPQPAVAGIAAVTAEARRYGFHATLKPPFVLRDTVNADALLRAAAALAATRQGFRIRLKLAVLDRFLALVPRSGTEDIQQLADCAVRDLDGFRAPPSPAELARRRQAALTERQERHLADWGYPYVFEDFRFHMTLTERLPAAEVARFEAAAAEHFAAVLAGPVAIDSITLFEEPEAGAPFLATRQFPFARSSAEVAA